MLVLSKEYQPSLVLSYLLFALESTSQAAVPVTQITGRKRGRPSSEDSSDDELVAPELLDPDLGSHRKKARLGYRGRQWITIFGTRRPMKQR